LDTLQLVDKFTLPSSGYGIDISGNELYIADGRFTMNVFNITTKVLIRQWNLSTYVYTIKVHDGNVYCGTQDNIVYIYNLTGNLIQQFGKKGSGNGEFHVIYCIEIENKFLFITDKNNHRIQVLHLENYTYSHQWGSHGTENGQFNHPSEIRFYSDLCYIGDHTCVQGFTKNGQFLCRFGKTIAGDEINAFRNIKGMLIIGNRLYVSEFGRGGRMQS